MRSRLIGLAAGTLAVLCLFSSSFQVLGQSKKPLLSKDYILWEKASRLRTGQVSPNGDWVYYSIKTAKGDSILVRNIKTGRQYNTGLSAITYNYNGFRREADACFSSQSEWVAMQDKDQVQVIHLPSGRRRSFGAHSFQFAHHSGILLLTKKDSSGMAIVIHNLTSGKQQQFKNVTAFSVNDRASELAIATDDAGICSAMVVRLIDKLPLQRVAATDGSLSAFTWSKTGEMLAFTQYPRAHSRSTARDSIVIVNIRSGAAELRKFSPAAFMTDGSHKGGAIRTIVWSPKAEQLLLEVEETKFANETSGKGSDSVFKPVQIWGASAPVLPPAEQLYNSTYWYAWHSEGRLEQITDSLYPNCFFSGDRKRVMVYHKRKYLPQHHFVNSFVDLYLKDRVSGALTLFAEQVKDQPDEFLVSPSGRYIAYFKDRDWWIYDFTSERHTNVTHGLAIKWESDRHNSTGRLPSYGSPGWIEDDRSLLLYDEYDIWKINPDGTHPKRITNGRQTETTFRLADTRLVPFGPGNGNQWFAAKQLAAKSGLLITSMAYRTMDHGFWWWTSDKGLEHVVTKHRKMEVVGQPEKQKALLFKESSFDLPPQLVMRHPSGKEEILYQTNPHQQQYQWGRTQVLRYRTPQGQQLSGALLFPANYDSTRKYPMVVEVYERRAKELHYYIEPVASTSHSSYVLNPSVYTAEGYFVLFPDITYRLNDPGVAATECVIAAVRQAVTQYAIDENRIGLTGHSFGGYETSFIITQTDLFKTAIASAPITDIPDFYLGVSGFGTNLTRVEEDQLRMNVPFYSEAFSRNSPIHHIEKMHTPLLLITGDADANVDWTQSRRLQIALWRLGKKSTMLVYPGEDHVIMQDNNQKDMAQRMKEWFDYNLKNEKPAAWISKAMGE